MGRNNTSAFASTKQAKLDLSFMLSLFFLAVFIFYPILNSLSLSFFLSILCRIVRGGNNLCDGPVDSRNLKKVMDNVQALGFGHKKQVNNKNKIGRKKGEKKSKSSLIGMKLLKNMMTTPWTATAIILGWIPTTLKELGILTENNIYHCLILEWDFERSWVLWNFHAIAIISVLDFL